MKQKKGQMKISFGMIFSIILIIAFLGFAFFAIQKFFSFQGSVTKAKFYENLNQDVAKVYTSTKSTLPVNYIVPRGTSQVCFKVDPVYNVYIYTDKPTPGEFVKNLNITRDFCVRAEKQKVNFTLEKNYSESLVRVKA